MLLNAMRDGESNHLVTYHNSINKSEKFQKVLESLKVYYGDDIEIYNIHGSMRMKQRINIIKSFINSEKAILTSARVLNEGINIPIIDSVCFIDPRMSVIDIVQCIGRALRLFLDKKLAKIYVPIIIEDINEIDENKTFGNIIRIIKSMSNTDTGINDYFVIRKEGGKVDRQLIRHKNCLSVEKVGEDIDIEDWIDSIDMKVWSKSDGFEYMYQEVKMWIDENDKIPSSGSKNIIEKKLGYWCSGMRQNKKQNNINSYRLKQLDNLSYWYWGDNIIRHIKTFDQTYSELKQWININNKIPSYGSKNNTEKQLGQWCSRMRKNKKQSKLEYIQIKQLEELHGWYWELDDIFDEYCNKLKQWIDICNKYPSQHSKDKIEKQLGVWCTRNRKCKKEGVLDNKKIKQLEELDGWFWKLDDPFDENYNKLKIWIEKHNTLPLPSSEDPEEIRLSRWCSHKRHNKKKGRLEYEKIKQLELLTYWFWTDETIERNTSSFDNIFNSLKIWIEKNNRIPSNSSKNKEERQFGVWCCSRRMDKKKEKLTKEKINKLETLQGWYWTNEMIKREYKDFEGNFTVLKQWIEEKNKIPSSGSEDKMEKKLGSWYDNQRKNKKNGKLDKEKIIKLEELTGWYWEKEDPFDKNYKNLKEWIDFYNKLPSHHSKNKEEKHLGVWCCCRRMDKKNGKLSTDKIKLIEALPHWFWSKDEKDNQTDSNDVSENDSGDDLISNDDESISDVESIEESDEEPKQKEVKNIPVPDKVRQRAMKKNITIV